MLNLIPTDEVSRLEALKSYALLDTPPEPEFDRVTALASKVFNVPVALVSLLDADRQWFKSCIGLEVAETPREVAFCNYTIGENRPLVVPDARVDERFSMNPLVTGSPHIRFYAGAPLTTRGGINLGSLCLIDTVPRNFSDAEVDTLTQLAAVVMAAIEARLTEERLRREIAVHEQTTQALRLVETRYQRIVANAPGMVYQFIRRADGRAEFPFVTDACREILGIEPAILTRDANDYHRLIHPEDRPAYLKAVAESVAGLKPLRWEGRYLLASGKVKWLQVSSHPERMPNGDLFWDGVLLDVTEHKRAEGRLRMLESSVEFANDAILVTDAEPVDEPGPRIIYANQAFTKTTGYTEAEVLGKTPRILQGPNTSLEARDTIRRALEAWEPVRVELLNYRKDGSEFWVELNIRPVANDNGRFTHWVSVQRDITERKQTQKALEESHHLLRAVIDGTDNIIFIKDREGRYVMINPAGAAILGCTPEEIVGKDDNAFFSLEDTRQIQASDQAILRSDRSCTNESSDMIRGVKHVFMSTKSPHHDASGQLLGVIGIVRDITARKAVEDALLAAKAEAERANAAKSEFLSGMSHELRTPLNAILGFGQLLELGKLDPRQNEGVAHILGAGRHLLSLIDEILDISRIESGKLELTPEAVDVGTLLAEVASLIAPQAAGRAIRVATRPAAGDDDGNPVVADRQRLRQILLNLLSNAIKYNREGGSAELFRTNLPADGEGRPWVRITVRDTGPGITPENLSRLFVPFERLDAAHRRIEGTGIGLALSKRLTEAMGGRITVESAVGWGSAFSIELPMAPVHADLVPVPALVGLGETNPPAIPSLATAAAFTVLYVEDNPANLRLVEHLLADHRPGVRLLSATEGKAGLDLARAHRPALILLDLHLPDMPGEAVLSALRNDERTHDTPVIVLSADATREQPHRLRDLGAQAYVTKPLDVPILLGAIDDAMGRGA